MEHAVTHEQKDKVTAEIGSTLTIRFDGDSLEEAEDITLVIPHDRTSSSDVSIDTPLGKELLGKKSGETILFQGPAGEVVVKIIAIW